MTANFNQICIKQTEREYLKSKHSIEQQIKVLKYETLSLWLMLPYLNGPMQMETRVNIKSQKLKYVFEESINAGQQHIRDILNETEYRREITIVNTCPQCFAKQSLKHKYSCSQAKPYLPLKHRYGIAIRSKC